MFLTVFFLLHHDDEHTNKILNVIFEVLVRWCCFFSRRNKFKLYFGWITLLHIWKIFLFWHFLRRLFLDKIELKFVIKLQNYRQSQEIINSMKEINEFEACFFVELKLHNALVVLGEIDEPMTIRFVQHSLLLSVSTKIHFFWSSNNRNWSFIRPQTLCLHFTTLRLWRFIVRAQWNVIVEAFLHELYWFQNNDMRICARLKKYVLWQNI